MASKITISKIYENASKTTGKPYWSVVDTNRVKFNIFDEAVASQLAEGQTVTVGITEKGGYKNITSVVPDSFVEASDDISAFLDNIPTTPLEKQVNDRAARDTSVVVAPPSPKPLHQELDLLVKERMSALDAAVSLIVHDKASINDIDILAERFVKFYQGVGLPKNVTKEHTRSESEEYLA